MALVNCKVVNDGSHYLALFPPRDAKKQKRGARSSDENFEKFKTYYSEVLAEGVPAKKVLSKIKDMFWERMEDISELPEDDDLKSYYGRVLKSSHAKKKRYFLKTFLNTWNWFITFTYDDKKITYEEFEVKIRKALSNLSSRNDWLYIAGREKGEEGGRSHLHVLARVEEGKMPGKLELRSHYSTKKRRMVYYTANTLFDKYGISDFSAISDPLECRNKIKYLIKYLVKSGESLIYSRGIKDYIEMVIDTEKDIATMYKTSNGGYKAVLSDSLFFTKDDPKQVENIKRKRFKKDSDYCFAGLVKHAYERVKGLKKEDYNNRDPEYDIVYNFGSNCVPEDAELRSHQLGAMFFVPRKANCEV